jgi:acetyltransferase-like isoleucine patch superfamily enzyme
MWQELSLKIRRRESPLYDTLYRIAKTVRSFEIPVVPGLYRTLYWERATRIALWRNMLRILYYTPMFKTRCRSIGKRLQLIGGIPLVIGHLKLDIGDDVSMYAQSTLAGARVIDNPTLTIGSNTVLGYQLYITVGADVTIGNNCLIAEKVTIMSYDGHHANPLQRHLPAPPESSRPITICDNVWIGAGSIILKGVTIGEGSIVAGGSVVTAKVPPNSMAIGNPARVFPLFM